MLNEVAGTSQLNVGDVYESPCFAVFQLVTGEVLALCNWDYRESAIARWQIAP